MINIKTWFKSLSERTTLMLLALVTGFCCGCMAVLLKKLIEIIRGLLTGNLTTAWNWVYLLLPGVGMLISLLFVRYIIKDDIGHGVTKVLLAVSKEKSHIKPHNIWSSIAASSVTIGFGGSVGAEAPIVYSGAAIGSNIARWSGLPYKDITILLGCGAAGAVAGIFKAPLAGVLFTLEILLFNISMTSILPILVSSLTATVVSYLFMDNTLAFSASLETFSMGNMPYYLVLGVFCGLMSLYFLRMTLWTEDRMKSIARPFVRWIVGASLLGLLIFLFPPLYGEGYDSLGLMLNNSAVDVAGGIFGTGGRIAGSWGILAFFAAILLLKVFATALTNSGGGIGGTFGPTLFAGGVAGFVIARLINMTGIHVVPEANFVLVGMAGMMAGVMQAPLTAIFLIAEITGGYSLLLPLIATSAISFATMRHFEPYSIYSKRIARQGALLTHDSDRAVLTLMSVKDVIETDFATIRIDGCLGDVTRRVAHSKRNIFPVVDGENHILGIIYLDDIRELMFETEKYRSVKVADLLKRVPASVTCDEQMESVMHKFDVTGAWNLPVVDEYDSYIGFVSKSKIFSSYREQLRQVSHD